MKSCDTKLANRRSDS